MRNEREVCMCVCDEVDVKVFYRARWLEVATWPFSSSLQIPLQFGSTLAH